MKLMTRNRDATLKQLGTIDKKDGKVVLNLPEPYKAQLEEIIFEGKRYKKDDPMYLKVLPLAYRGDYLWVEP